MPVLNARGRMFPDTRSRSGELHAMRIIEPLMRPVSFGRSLKCTYVQEFMRGFYSWKKESLGLI